MKLEVANVKNKRKTVSHDKLVERLVSFLNSAVEDISYDKFVYKKTLFGDGLHDVNKNASIILPSFRDYSVRDFMPEVRDIVQTLQKRVNIKKFNKGFLEDSKVSQYLASISNLGWINCDRFLDLDETQKTDLVLTGTKGGRYYLVFKDLKSLVKPIIKNDKVVFTRLPKNAAVKVIALVMENNKAKVATQDLVLGSDEDISMTYRDTDTDDLKRIFSEL